MNRRGITRAAIMCALLGSGTGVAQAEKIYWREDQGTTGGTIIKRSNLDGTSIEQLVTIPTADINSFGLALDLEGGKMYWAEREDGEIRRANLDGGNPEDVLTGLNLPLNVALDLADGRIYWTQDETGSPPTDPGVYRAYLDGSGVELLLAGDFMGIALDPSAGKMYLTMTSPDVGPARANLDGTGYQLLIPYPTYPNIFGHTFCTAVALDVSGGKMYFTAHPAYGGSPPSIGRANLDGSSPEVVLLGAPSQPYEPIGYPLGIALDTGRAHMYWSNIGSRKIYRANMDGSGAAAIHELAPLMPSTLALDLRVGPPIPAVSEWGAAAMTLLVLTAGTLVLAGRRAAVR